METHTKVIRRRGEFFVSLSWSNGTESGNEEMGPFDDEVDAAGAAQRAESM